VERNKSEAVDVMNKGKEREKHLEFRVNSMQQQVKTVNEMVQKLKEAMPSDDLAKLVGMMQDVTK